MHSIRRLSAALAQGVLACAGFVAKHVATGITGAATTNLEVGLGETIGLMLWFDAAIELPKTRREPSVPSRNSLDSQFAVVSRG